MNKKAIAKNLLDGKTCMNCMYMSTVYRMSTTNKKKQCTYRIPPNYSNKPLPKVLTCLNYKNSGSSRARIKE